MNQLWTAALVLGAQLLPGFFLVSRMTRHLQLGVAGHLALVPLTGLMSLGLLTLVSGHLGYLGPGILIILALAGAVGCFYERRQISALLRSAWAEGRRQWLLSPVSLTAVGLGLVLATVVSFAPPWRIDEVEYHWPAPLEWVAAGHWVDSSYKHVDGFPFMEICYTAAATLGSFAGAHLLHLTTLVAIGLAAAQAGRSLGVRATGAVAAAAMAMPVMWDQAYVAYNDTAVGGFAMAAAAIALTGHRSWSRMGMILALLVTAISIKPTGLGAVGLVGIIILMSEWKDRRGAGQRWFVRTLKAWGLLAAAAIVAVLAWSTRRYALTGTWVDPTLTGPPSEDVLSRLPSQMDHLIAPVIPFVLGLVGSQEPWGGRTGVITLVLLVPTLLYVLIRRGDVGFRYAQAIVPAWAHWIALGLSKLRTRFHIVAWALFAVGLRVAVEDAMHRYPRFRFWLGAAWAAAVVLSVVDVSFEMLRTIRDAWFS